MNKEKIIVRNRGKEGIWVLIGDYYMKDVSAAPATNSNNETISYGKNEWRSVRILGTLGGVLFWLYAIMQIFIFNVDQWLNTVTPNFFYYIIEYKILLFIGLFLISAILYKKYIFLLTYIFLFPLIIVFWEVPRLIYFFRSWVLVVAVFDFIIGLFIDFKRRIIFFLFGLCAIVLSTTYSKSLLYISIILSLLVISHSVLNTIIKSFSNRSFMAKQARLIDKLTDSGFVKSMTLIDDKLKTKNRLTEDQKSAIVSSAQTAVIYQRILLFWAYQLKKYSESSARLVINWINFISLAFVIIIYLTVINVSLYKIYPSGFMMHGNTNIIVFLYYSISSLFFSEVSIIQAQGSIIIAFKILSGALGAVFLGSFGINIIYSLGNKKDLEVITKTIDDIKIISSSLEKKIQNEYSIESVDALIDKLQDVGASLTNILIMITKQIPIDFRK